MGFFGSFSQKMKKDQREEEYEHPLDENKWNHSIFTFVMV